MGLKRIDAIRKTESYTLTAAAVFVEVRGEVLREGCDQRMAIVHAC